jgi:hypothetical protein
MEIAKAMGKTKPLQKIKVKAYRFMNRSVAATTRFEAFTVLCLPERLS